MSRRFALLISLLGMLSSPVLAEEIFAPDNKVETDVTACLADARAKAPDATAHNRRVLMATACVCDAHKELCRSGIPQDGHLRQRINEDK
jgi:hypothetical protein